MLNKDLCLFTDIMNINLFNLGNKFLNLYADVAELVDALDLGSSAARHGGSSPFIRTK